MSYGVVNISVLPVRKEPSHRSEMVTQLLFGETYRVLDTYDGKWLKIACCYDNYEGWISEVTHAAITAREYEQWEQAPKAVSLDVVCMATHENHNLPLLFGSTLPHFDGMSFKLMKEKYVFNGTAVTASQANFSAIEKIASRFLNAPYLWGGRSPFGIDCSGFTQVVFKALFIPLLRDAWQQAGQGNIINFVDEALPGDLAFFAGDDDKITHVGIVMKDKRIIHASGKVRIDLLDHFGIYNREKKKYSHRLKIIKRVI
ncbi:MAG: C40 family peptidase [Chitinophagales bacterium]|nr:C40 family peptidase [Chitinophagales bacterium]MDW8272936.1 C40 family peptidase [Chitinophagales bacterium]